MSFPRSLRDPVLKKGGKIAEIEFVLLSEVLVADVGRVQMEGFSPEMWRLEQ